MLGRKVRGEVLARATAAAGRCSAAARRCRRSLAAAIKVAARATVYSGDPAAAEDGDQWCFDAVRQRPIGGATQPLIHWINRPTYQQVTEVQGPVTSLTRGLGGLNLPVV